MFSAIGRFMKEFRQIILAPVLIISLAALSLHALGTVPAHLSSPPGKEYADIEKAALDMGFNIVVPVYFPNYLAWPPEKILGQTTPFKMVQMSFLSTETHNEILLIYQIVSDTQDVPLRIPWIETINQRLEIVINGNTGELTVGTRANGDTVNLVHWRENGQHFLMVTTQPVKELLALAKSMYPDGP